MSASSPTSRYFKDGNGLVPNWRFALRWPRQFIWMRQPRWLLKYRCKRRDRR